MKHTLALISSFMLIAAASSSLNPANEISHSPSAASAVNQPATNRSRPRRGRRKFRFVYRTCESGCIENYKSSNGQEVRLAGECYSASAEDAVRDMQKDVLDEGRIIRRSWRRDQRGRRGERIVVIYPKSVTGEKLARIVWYVPGDSCFGFIEAGSLRLALDFERSKAGAENWMQ